MTRRTARNLTAGCLSSALPRFVRAARLERRPRVSKGASAGALVGRRDKRFAVASRRYIEETASALADLRLFGLHHAQLLALKERFRLWATAGFRLTQILRGEAKRSSFVFLHLRIAG